MRSNIIDEDNYTDIDEIIEKYCWKQGKWYEVHDNQNKKTMPI